MSNIKGTVKRGAPPSPDRHNMGPGEAIRHSLEALMLAIQNDGVRLGYVASVIGVFLALMLNKLTNTPMVLLLTGPLLILAFTLLNHIIVARTFAAAQRRQS